MCRSGPPPASSPGSGPRPPRPRSPARGPKGSGRPRSANAGLRLRQGRPVSAGKAGAHLRPRELPQHPWVGRWVLSKGDGSGEAGAPLRGLRGPRLGPGAHTGFSCRGCLRRRRLPSCRAWVVRSAPPLGNGAGGKGRARPAGVRAGAGRGAGRQGPAGSESRPAWWVNSGRGGAGRRAGKVAGESGPNAGALGKTMKRLLPGECQERR